MTQRNLLLQAIDDYRSAYREEAVFKKRFLKLLEHPRAFFRDHLPGHITASTWIIDPSRKFSLLTHHAKLLRWLQPGGHADGEEDVLAVAQREAREETGLASLRTWSADIFDLDIHPIPARADFPEHDHFDVRFLLVASMEEPFTISQESKDLAWIPAGNIAHVSGENHSILRMAEKVRNLP